MRGQNKTKVTLTGSRNGTGRRECEREDREDRGWRECERTWDGGSVRGDRGWRECERGQGMEGV